MADHETPTESHHVSWTDRLDEIVAAYLRAVERGETPDRDELLARNAGLADELRKFFANHDRVRQPTQPLIGPTVSSSDATIVARLPEHIRAFGDYELLEEIARGGMGVVFKARQITLNRIVAVKMILSGQLASPRDVERFHTEAEAAAKLDHPGIVPIYEIGQHHGQHYFSMGFVEGRSLAARVAQGPLPAREAAEIVRAVTQAVQFAHDRGVIHRDLKPGNILLDRQGKPRVTDFGVAKLPESDSELTGTGQVLGTPGYMPPEQAAGKISAVGRSSDVYSLGAILYCLLTGRPPFQAATPVETLLQVQQQEPVPPRRLNPAIPFDLDTIALKCLEREPSHRYPTAAELGVDLRRFLTGEPIAARPIGRVERSWRWCRRNPVLAALITAVVVSLLALTITSSLLAVFARAREIEATALSRAAGAAQKKARGEARAAKAARLRARNEARHALDLLARNKRLAGENAAHLYRLSINNGLRLTDQGDVYGALLWFVEPIVREPENPGYQAAARMRLASYLRNTSRFRNVGLLNHNAVVTHIETEPGGRKIVAVCSDHTARIWDLERMEPVGEPMVHSGTIVSASFSPDGRLILTASEDGTARIWNAATGLESAPPLRHEGHRDRPKLEPNDESAGVKVQSAEFSADGSHIVTVDAEGAVYRWYAATGLPIGQPLETGSVNSAKFEPSGRRIITGGDDGTVRLWDVTSGEPTGHVFEHDPAGGGPEHSPASVRIAEFSPDGRWFISVASGRLVHVWDLASGRRVGRVLTHQDILSAAMFDPSGAWVVTAVADGTARVWEAATGQSIGPPLAHDREVACAAVSLDGRWIATGSGRRVHVWDAATGKPCVPALVHHAPVTCIRFAADGFRILTSGEDGAVRIWELSEDRSGDPLQETEFGEFPPFYYSKHSDGTRSLRIDRRRSSVAVVDDRSGSVVQGPLYRSEITSASFSPDGRRVATTSSDRTAWIWDAATGRVLVPAIRDVNTIAFSEDSRQFVTSNFRNYAQVWETATGKPVGSAMVHQGAVTSALFSPDGYFVVTGSTDKTARVWEAATGCPAGPPLLHQAAVDYAGFESGGRSIVTFSGEDRRRWNLAPDESRDEDLFALARLLAARSLDAQGEFLPLAREEIDRLQQLVRGRYPEEFAHVPPESVRTWRWHRIEEARSNNRWLAAGFHLNQLIAAGPLSASLAIRRAIATLNAAPQGPLEGVRLAQLLKFPENLEELAGVDPLWWCCDPQVLDSFSGGNREMMVEILSGALETGARDPDWWNIPAFAALAAGNYSRYREICRQMTEQFADQVDAPLALRILVLLLPDDHMDAATAATFSRLGTLVASELSDVPRIVGAVRFRQGEYQAAWESFQKTPESDEADDPRRARDFLFLAMIQHRLGRTTEARELLRRGCEWIDGNPKIQWIEKAGNAELLRQAEALIHAPAPP
jgi:WD40 repeat protein/tRNA A-37 threonylcarbamoyl transferase component Bud32